MVPSAKIIRLDIDSSKNKGAHYEILNKFENQEYNVLLGTQMIAKGLDFDKIEKDIRKEQIDKGIIPRSPKISQSELDKKIDRAYFDIENNEDDK